MLCQARLGYVAVAFETVFGMLLQELGCWVDSVGSDIRAWHVAAIQRLNPAELTCTQTTRPSQDHLVVCVLNCVMLNHTGLSLQGGRIHEPIYTIMFSQST